VKLLPEARPVKAMVLLGVLIVVVGAVGTFSHSLGWFWALLVLAGLGLLLYADHWNREHKSGPQ
jgi:type IV secretory pathway VirB2 component (pilin)